MDSVAQLSRRGFLKHLSLSAGSVVTATTLGTLSAHSAWAQQHRPSLRRDGHQHSLGKGYGPLQRAADQNGEYILALPEGFRYVSFGKTGEMMSDGSPTPRSHDGMSCFANPDGSLRLIRNHELRNGPGDFNLAVLGPEASRYDALAGGGCVALDFDPEHKALIRDFVVLNGTLTNCSGGVAYRDAGWLSCEESVFGPEQGFQKPHGYTFFVPRDRSGTEPTQPLTAMGRFAKEAAVADAVSGIVYQTEDAGDYSGFYRFLPQDPDNLLRGGRLQMLAVRGRSQYDTRRNQRVGVQLPVRWVSIDQPNPLVLTSSSRVFAQGYAKGGARFNRLEGLFRGDDSAMYFTSTSGGNARYGQLWKYSPDQAGNGVLELVFESPSGSVLDSPDNLCVTPSGGILLCEDDASANDADPHPLAPDIANVNRLIGLTRSGKPFEFAVNIHNDTELAGACFSPNGEILFVNVFGNGELRSGMTCAIWGPWRRGPL